jgi:hypothetical protein
MAERHPFGRAPLPGPLADAHLLATSEGARVLARIRCALCPESPIDLDDYAQRVALDAIKARMYPRTRFARPTLETAQP